MRALFCGSRDWTDDNSIRKAMLELQPLCVITGGARGADGISNDIARELGIETEVYPADWATYGRAAGPIRNRQMIVEGKPDVVVAFSYDLDKSKGTHNMVHQAEVAEIRVIVIGQQYEQPQQRLI